MVQHRFWRVFAVAALGVIVVLFTTAARLAQPPIPHDLTGRQDCLACHKEGVGGASKFPADHVGRANETCQGCHAPTSLPGAAPTTAPGGPPIIPHDVIGRDDCLVCHATGQAGARKAPASHAGRAKDTCRTCHQPSIAQPTKVPPAPVVPPPTLIPHPAAGGKNSCADCHKALSGKLKQPVTDWEGSIHAARNVACADCHGGDPTSPDPNRSMASAAGYIGAPDKASIPGLCGSCHANVDLMRQFDLPTDQLNKYRESQHGQLLAKGDRSVATCFDCHDGHATREINDPGTSVYPFNVPGLCARCHSDAALMKPYGIPINQDDLFKSSVHGITLLTNQDLRAPSCATCHGTHGAAPPGFEQVANVCGSCHNATQEYFLKSKHAIVQGGPKCVTCHGRYDVGVPSDDMFLGNADRQCGQCHPAGSPQAETVKSLYTALHQASGAYDEAEQAIAQAASVQMIVALEESQLQQAKTSLLTARAAQHTLQLADVSKLAGQATSIGQQTKQAAEAKVAESVLRRQAMVIAVVLIGLVIVSLVIVKRSLESH